MGPKPVNSLLNRFGPEITVTFRPQKKTETEASTKASTRTTPSANILVDGFIVGNLDSNLSEEEKSSTQRKDLEKENAKETAEGKEEDLSSWAWMDANKKQQLANMESQMLDEYTQSIIKNGLRPMFEFNFFQEDIKQAAAELQKLQEDDHVEVGEDLETTTLSNPFDEDDLTTDIDSLIQLYDDTQEEQVHHHHDHGHDQEHHEHDHGDDQEHNHGDMSHHEHHPHGHEHGEDHQHHHHHDHHNEHDMPHAQVSFPILEDNHLGLEATRADLTDDEKSFIDINNDLGLEIFRKLLKTDTWKTSNFIFSPLSALTSVSMLFLGARGDTSWQINELLKLDEIVSFNPHLLYKNVTDSLMLDEENSKCVKQLFIQEVRREIG